MPVSVNLDSPLTAYRPTLSQRLNRKPKSNRSTDSNSLETMKPSLQYGNPLQIWVEQFEITLNRNPQSIVTVFVSSQPAPKDGLHSNKTDAAGDQQNEGPSCKISQFTKISSASTLLSLHPRSMDPTKKQRHKL
jgi:hypothetical protein